MAKKTLSQEYIVEFVDEKAIHKGVVYHKGATVQLLKEEWENLKKKDPKHIKFL